jgi:hypothetical protein
MERRIIAVAAAFAVAALGGAYTAQASQCSTACDQTYSKCDANGGKTCLPQWGQCKKACTAQATAPAKTTPVVATKPVTKPKP